MNPELQKFLEQSCPSVFPDGACIQHNDGWFLILFDLCGALEELGNVKAAQVKEKFGGLRFYYDLDVDPEDPGRNDLFDGVNQMIEAAEQLCAITCEDCGRSGRKVTRNGWTRTLCERCRP